MAEVRATLRQLRWPLLALLAMLVAGAIFAPGFLSIEVRDGRFFGTPIDILNHGSKVAIVAIGMTLVIATGGVDLSVGAVVAMSAAVVATLASADGGRPPWPAPFAVAAALLVAIAAGLWNGFLVTFLRLQPIVATLVLMVAGRGIAQLVTDGLIVTVSNPSLVYLGNGALLGLPATVTLLAAMAIAAGLATRGTTIGLFIEAVGDNPTAARLAGVPARGVTILVYAACGLCAGVVGLIDCAYIRAADANNAGQLLELDAILAVVIGGTALTGGRFTILGSIVGALLMQTLTKLLYMLDVSAEIAPAPKAAVVLAVCLLQSPALRSRVASLLRAAARRGTA